MSPLVGQFVAFDIVKVNPFHQMIGKDSALAALFYGSLSSGSSMGSSDSRLGDRSLLTLENIKMHEKFTQDSTTKFHSRLAKLLELADKRTKNQGPSTNFTGTFSIFDALYELESFNSLHKSEALVSKVQPMTQEEYKDLILQKMLSVNEIDRSFSQLHLLIDRVFENQKNMNQNSNLFHLKFAMMLSSLVQMKNSLLKYLEHEAREGQPELKMWTQAPVVDRNTREDNEDEWSFYTPMNYIEEKEEG